MDELSVFIDRSELTLVMGDHLLQGAEGDSWRDVESSVVQRSDLVMFDRVPSQGVAVPDGQRVAACRQQPLLGKLGGIFIFYSLSMYLKDKPNQV